jgi:hypothetical protein
MGAVSVHSRFSDRVGLPVTNIDVFGVHSVKTLITVLTTRILLN